MRIRKALIIDGYNDEPGGLGVPPYMDVYPRYIAGALWSVDKGIRVDYVTADEFRSSRVWLSRASGYDLVVVIAGVVVPGRYLGGIPATVEEVEFWGKIIDSPLKVLVGPAARWGMGLEGGRPAVHPSRFKRSGYHVLVTGDVEVYFYELARYGPEKASPYSIREDYSLVDRVSVLGARIVKQHPNYGRNLVVEIETYRGCARWVSGGCSFCVEPLRGRPIQRDPESIVREVAALYEAGVRAFRLGRQADILVYGSRELGSEEWPRPNPEALEKLMKGIRAVAPRLEVLHIDNVNPGTIARHVEDSVRALKAIILYHTPGDVAAMGLETADPRVAKINNLNTTPEEALEAIRIVNRVGALRGWNGLPHLLPGINFILGLPGETRSTYDHNRAFLERILEEGLMVRRVNIRRLLVIPLTRASIMKRRSTPRLESLARSFTNWVRRVFDREMLRRIAPPGTILRNLWVESCSEGVCYARQTGSYPLVAAIPCRLPRHTFLEKVLVTGIHSSRAVKGLPVPLSEKSRQKVIAELVGLGREEFISKSIWSHAC